MPIAQAWGVIRAFWLLLGMNDGYRQTGFLQQIVDGLSMHSGLRLIHGTLDAEGFPSADSLGKNVSQIKLIARL